MPLSLTEGVIADYDSCVHKDLLAYIRYPEGDYGSRCFAFPRYLYSDDKLTRLTNTAFPDNGCLSITLANTSKQEVQNKYGSIVIMVVNDKEQLQYNYNYGRSEQSQYNAHFNPTRARRRSEVVFDELSRHALSSLMMQIVKIKEHVDFEYPLNETVYVQPEQAAPQTRLLLVKQSADGGEKLFGPFEYATSEDGGLHLQAVSLFEKFIGCFDVSSFKTIIELDDEDGSIVASFVDTDEFRGKFDNAVERFDWVSDDELIDAVGRISRIGESALPKSKMRVLKADLKTCADADAKIALTPQRRERMISLITTHDNWSSLPDETKGEILANANPELLANFVLTSDYFKPFYEKVIENDSVRAKVEMEKARYSAAAESSKKEAEEAEARLESVLVELGEYDAKLASRKAALEDEVELAAKNTREERDRLQAEVLRLKEERDVLNEDKILVQRQIRKTIDDMSDELSVSSKILENEMIKQIVSSINATDVSSESARSAIVEAPAVFPHSAVRPDGDDMDPASVLKSIEKSICVDAGRDFAHNEVVNMMICLIQGYITTFAGLPGTGKTSLASILASAIGLSQAEALRVVEVPVEKGWTSYKDFIGYYNPFTMQMEKSNSSVFNAFELLSEEAEQGFNEFEVAPFVFVLDEANLSSVEHYWSPFLRACDSFGNQSSTLSLGGEASLVVPNYVRFIATVNFDHTTEELSPRFLDRSWVITLDPEPLDFESDVLGVAHDFSSTQAYSYGTLKKVFGPRNEVILDAELMSKYKEVADTFSRHHNPISNRSQMMIYHYACTASKLMDRSSAQTAYAPIDYAVSQKLLPLLSGTDDRVGNLLRDLGSIGGLPVMRHRIERMVEVGEDSGFYQYFA